MKAVNIKLFRMNFKLQRVRFFLYDVIMKECSECNMDEVVGSMQEEGSMYD